MTIHFWLSEFISTSHRTTEKQILKARSVSSYVSETNLEVKLKIKNLILFWGGDLKWEMFPFFALIWRTSASRASKKFSVWVTDIFWLCNDNLWLQDLQRYQNHGVWIARTNRTHIFEKTVPSPAFWILLLYLQKFRFFME